MNIPYTAVIVPADEGGFCGYILEVPGVNSQGDTEEELLENLKDALALMLECLREDAAKDLEKTGARQTVLKVAS
jgi:predicted RNase H-like HicB family nuclease